MNSRIAINLRNGDTLFYLYRERRTLQQKPQDCQYEKRYLRLKILNKNPLPLIRYLRPGVAQTDGFVKHGAAVAA